MCIAYYILFFVILLIISLQWGHTSRQLIRIITWDDETAEISNSESSEDEGNKKTKHLDKAVKTRKDR